MTLALTERQPNVSAATSLAWRVYSASDVTEPLVRWRHLERRLDSRSVTCCAAWTECWIQHYGDLVPFQILVAESAGEVRGMCLLTSGVSQKAGPFPLSTRHVGTAGEPDGGSICVEYNRPLAEPRYRDEFVNGVARVLRERSNCDEIRLDGLSEADLQPWLPHFPGARTKVRDSRFFDLHRARTAGQDVLTSLGKSTRSNIRRLLKKYGPLDGEWAESIEQGVEIFEELVQLHQQRWQAAGETGAFAHPRFLSFQRELTVRLLAEKRAVLFRLRQGDRTIGCLMLLVDENRLLDYLSGFVSFEERPSPGLITHYICQEEALARDFDAYDFLVGEKRHKENLSTDVGRLCWLAWARPSLKNRTIQLLRNVRNSLRRPASPSATNL